MVTYAEDVTEIFQQHGIPHHLFADDMQGIGCSKPSRVNEVATKLAACVSAVSNWCAAKHLQLITKKTEVMWFGLATNLDKLSLADQHIQVGPDNVSPSSVVRDLGVFFDSELTMKSRISRITSACFYQLRRLRAVRGHTWTRSHRSSSLRIHFVEAGLLQCHPGRPPGINTRTAAAGYACHCSSHLRPQAIRPRHTDTQGPHSLPVKHSIEF